MMSMMLQQGLTKLIMFRLRSGLSGVMLYVK